MANAHMSSAAAALAGVAPAAPASAGKAMATPDETLFGALVEAPRPEAAVSPDGDQSISDAQSVDRPELAADVEIAAAPVAIADRSDTAANTGEQATPTPMAFEDASARPSDLSPIQPSTDIPSGGQTAWPLPGAEVDGQAPAAPAAETNAQPQPQPHAAAALPSAAPNDAENGSANMPAPQPAPEGTAHAASARLDPARETSQPSPEAPAPKPAVAKTPELAPADGDANGSPRAEGPALAVARSNVDVTDAGSEAPARDRPTPPAMPEARDAARPMPLERDQALTARDEIDAPTRPATERHEAPQQTDANRPPEPALTDPASAGHIASRTGGDTSVGEVEQRTNEFHAASRAVGASTAPDEPARQLADRPTPPTRATPDARPEPTAGRQAEPMERTPRPTRGPDAPAHPDVKTPKTDSAESIAPRPTTSPEAQPQAKAPEQALQAEQASERPDRYGAKSARPQSDDHAAAPSRSEGAPDASRATPAQPALETISTAADLPKPETIERAPQARTAPLMTAQAEAATAPDPAALAADPLERAEAALDRAGQPAKLAAHRFHAAMAHQTPTGQVAFSIAQSAADAAERIRIQMFPRELGEVEVMMDVQEDRRTEVVVRAERAETMELLQKDARELQRVLQAAGLDVAYDDLSFELGGHGADGEGDHKSGADSDRADADDSADARLIAHTNRWRAVTPGGVDLVA